MAKYLISFPSDGKEHRYFSIVENKRVADGRVVQRHVLYLGEINSSQELAWRKSIEVFEDGQAQPSTLALFPADRCEAVIADESVVRVRLSELELCRPRQWGACWLVVKLWRELELDRFWSERLSPSRKGTRWDQVLLVLVAYRLIAPGSEWRLHREWFGRTALADLLGADFSLAESHKLYACHDFLLEHKQALFDHLVGRWRDLFNASFEVLLYDLTSTYFESDPPQDENDKRRFGHSRDKRSDCVQVVVENQLALADEPVVRALDRLVREGLSRHDAVHAIGSVVAEEIYVLLKEQDIPDTARTRYYAAIERLTAASWRANSDD